MKRLTLRSQYRRSFLTRQIADSRRHALDQMGLQTCQQFGIPLSQRVADSRIGKPFAECPPAIEDPESNNVPQIAVGQTLNSQNTFWNTSGGIVRPPIIAKIVSPLTCE